MRINSLNYILCLQLLAEFFPFPSLQHFAIYSSKHPVQVACFYPIFLLVTLCKCQNPPFLLQLQSVSSSKFLFISVNFALFSLKCICCLLDATCSIILWKHIAGSSSAGSSSASRTLSLIHCNITYFHGITNTFFVSNKVFLCGFFFLYDFCNKCFEITFDCFFFFTAFRHFLSYLKQENILRSQEFVGVNNGFNVTSSTNYVN